MVDLGTFLSTLMGVIATLFALYIATSVLIFQTISDYKKEFKDLSDKNGGLKKQLDENPEIIDQLKEKRKEILGNIKSLNEIIESLNEKIESLNEKIEQFKKETKCFHDNVDQLNTKLKEISGLLKKKNQALNEKERLLKEKNGLLRKIKELQDKIASLKPLKDYNEQIKSLTNVFLILAILVIIFEIYNGMLIYFSTDSISIQSNINLMQSNLNLIHSNINLSVSFAFFVVLVALIIGYSCDMFYYMVSSQNPNLFDENLGGRIKVLISRSKFFNIIVTLPLFFIVFTFLCYLSVKVKILSYSFVPFFILSFAIAHIVARSRRYFCIILDKIYNG